MAIGRLASFFAVSLLCLAIRDAVDGATDPVPLLAWSNRDAFSSVTKMTGEEKADVESLVQRSKFKDLGFVIVFRTEKLSFEDIAKYGNAYDDESKDSCALSNIKEEMEDAVSSIWTGVGESAASLLVEEIALKLDMSPKFISGMEDVAVIFGQPQLLVVDLPYGDSGGEFAQQDAMVAEVLEAVQHLDTAYAAFYTAMTTKSLQETMVRPLLAKRAATIIPSLESSLTMCPVSYGVRDSDGSYCALLCLRNSTIYYWESETDLEEGESPCIANIIAFDEKSISGCNSSTIGPYASIFATVQGNCSHDDEDDIAKVRERVIEIEIEFTFPRGEFEQEGQWILGEGYWQMMMIVGPYNLSRDDNKKLPYQFSVPFGISYSCDTDSTATITSFSNPNRFVQLSNETHEKDEFAAFDGRSPVIQFIGIQVQAYGYTMIMGDGPIFNTVYDCNGFFTLPSITGIFCTLIILIVLYLATVAAFSIVTVDKFEDPRGPGISVVNLH